MVANNILAQLRDIHLPKAISWWPPAIGWYILFFIVLLVVVFTFYFGLKKWYRNRAKRRALKILQALRKNSQQYTQKEMLIQLSQLLRRICLVYFPKNQVAGLTGQAWLKFLDEHGTTNDFSQGIGQTLVQAPYCKETLNIEVNALFDLVQKWIKQR